MNSVCQRFSLDLHEQDSMVYVYVRRWDTLYELSVLLKESGIPYSITDGTTVILAACKPGETYKYVDCTVENDRIKTTLPADITAAQGAWEACFRLTGDGETLSSPAFTIMVEYHPFV